MRLKLLLTIVSLIDVLDGEPCTEYGCPGRPKYEPFVPAPPGHTPRCAKPGQTFCESPDHYPRQLIKFLVDKCSFDFGTVLRDETREDFETYRSPPDYDYPPQGYDYPRQEIPSPLYAHAPVFSPIGNLPVGHPAPIYGPPSTAATNSTQRGVGYKYSGPSERRNPFLPDVPSSAKQEVYQTDNRSWLTNRYARKAGQTSYRENPLLEYAKSKRKRQSGTLTGAGAGAGVGVGVGAGASAGTGTPDAIPLCPTEARYIAPRAALNNQGNWMYVVNLQENRNSQVVRSERCSTDTCNGLCATPQGYTSRCQQQYVQKRLVALEGTGNRLYTDVFWFPHGCSCQITLNY